MPVNTKTLYETLKKDPNYSGIGNTLESFKAYFSKPENANKLYSALSADENYEGIGKDINSFTSYFGLKGDTPVTLPKQPSIGDLYKQGNVPQTGKVGGEQKPTTPKKKVDYVMTQFPMNYDGLANSGQVEQFPKIDVSKYGSSVTDNTKSVQTAQTNKAAEAQVAGEKARVKIKNDLPAAIQNTAEIYFKEKGIKPTPDQLTGKILELQDQYTNKEIFNDYTPSGKPVMMRDAGFLESLIPSFKAAINAEDEADKVVNMSNEEAANYFDNKTEQEKYLPPSTKYSASGAIAETIGGSAPIIGRAIGGGIIGAGLVAAAPESAGASLVGLPAVMSFAMMSPSLAATGYANAFERYYREGVEQGLPKEEAIAKARTQAYAGEVKELAMGAALSTTPFKAASQGVGKSVGKYLENAAKTVGKNTAYQSAAAGTATLLQQGVAKAQGYNVTPKQAWDETWESATEMAKTGIILHLAMQAPQLPGFVNAQIKNALTKIPRPIIDDLTSKAVLSGEITPEMKANLESSIADFNEVQNQVPKGYPEEKRASLLGLIQKRNKLNNQLAEELSTAAPEFKSDIEKKYEGEINSVTAQIKEMKDAKETIPLERDALANKPLTEQEQNDIDTKVKASQERLKLTDTPELNLSDEAKGVIEKINNGENILNEDLDLLSGELYNKYNTLSKTKNDVNRRHTREQYDNTLNDLANKIDILENHKNTQAEAEDFVKIDKNAFNNSQPIELNPELTNKSITSGDAKNIEDRPVWNNTGTKFNNVSNEGGDFIGKDGKKYKVSINEDGIEVYDENGKKAGWAVLSKYDNGDNKIIGVSSKVKRAGIATAMYDFVDSQIGKVRQSGHPTEEGSAFWNANKPKEPTSAELPQVNEVKNEITIPEENTGNKQVDKSSKKEIIADAELDKNKQPTEEKNVTLQNQKIETDANDIITGKKVFERFSPQEQRGLTDGGKVHVESSLILAKENGTGKENAASNEEQSLSTQKVNDKVGSGVGGDVKELNSLGADIAFDKPQRKDYGDGEKGDLEYANANIEHNKKVDEIIGGLTQEGTLRDNKGGEYLVTITSQGVRVVNKMADGTEGSDISYRKGQRITANTPFTKGFSFKPKEQSLSTQPKTETKTEVSKQSKEESKLKDEVTNTKTKETVPDKEVKGDVEGTELTPSEKRKALAASIRENGWQKALGLKTPDLPEGTKKAGGDFGKAIDEVLAFAIETYDTLKEAIDHVKEYFKNNPHSNEKEIINGLYEIYGEKVPPIKEEPPVTDGKGDGKESLSYKNVIERSKVLTKAQKDILVNDPARFYNEQKIEVVKKFATDLVNELGADRAEVEATNMNNEMQPVERTFILGAVADHWARLGQEAEAKGKLGDAEFYADKEIEANNKYKQVFQKLSLLGRDYGRAINVFSDIYKLSGFALERKLKNATDEYNKAVAPQVDSKVNEVKDALKEKPTDLQEVISEINNDELTQTQNEKIADLEKQIVDLKKEINTRDNTKVGTQSNPLKIKRITSAQGYSEALKRLRNKTNSGIAPEDFKDMVYIGTYHIENGVTRFADWVSAMVKAAGKKYQDHFADIYKKSKEDAVERGADKTLFDGDSEIDGYYSSDKNNKEYKKLETERNRQLAKVGALKDKLSSLEKDGLPTKESQEAEKDTPEIEALKKRVNDLEIALRKKESDAKNTETNIEKLNKELIRVRERRAKEKVDKKPSSKELSDEEEGLVAQIKAENEKWTNEKLSAAQAKKNYSALETERNRQIKRVDDLKKKLATLKAGSRPTVNTKEVKLDTPEIENLKAEIKKESEKLSVIEAQQNRVNDLEKELKRLQDRKDKEPTTTTKREVSDREKELKELIAKEKIAINKEWKDSPEYQAESDAKKMAAITKRKAVADFNKAMADNPDRARIIAPKLAAKRILNDAKSNLDTPSMANEKTYLQKLVKVVRDKAAEYYKEKKENVSNVNDMLAFAIANGKKDYAIWDRTKEELERQIDADNKLSDTEKAEVKSFLEDYTDSVFDTFLTDRQQENVIREKLIEAGHKTEKLVNGKNVVSVDWGSVTKSAKNISEAKEQVKKAIMDLGFSEKEAKPTIDAILAKMDTKITDKRTKEINSILNKSALNKVKSALGVGTRKAQIKKLMDWNDKGLLTNDGVKEILSEQLGVKSLTQAEINEIKRLNDLANDEGINQFRRKKYEEEINWILENKQGNMAYKQTMEGYMSQLLGAASTQIQNISGLARQLSSIGSTIVKTGEVKGTLRVAKKALQQSNSNLRTVLKGDVSRGIAFSDITANTEGEPRTRYLEYGKAKLLGILPDLYVQRNGKTVNLNVLNEGWRKVKYITRAMEAMDTIGSTLSAKLDQYATLKISYKKWFPQKSSAEIETMVRETINSIPMADARSEAIKKFDNEGIKPTKYQINRAADEILERNLNIEYSKQFYEAAKEAEKVAKLKFESQGIEPTEAQLQKEVQLNMGSSEPIDLVAKGERKALRETGKVSTGGVTGLVLMPFNAINKAIKGAVKNTEAGSVNKGLANASDFAYSTLFAFANGAARWTEMGLELSPYGLVKGGTYKLASYKELKQGNVERAAELSDYGTDMVLRGIQGTAQTLGTFYLMALYNKLQKDDDKKAVITGESEENNYTTQRIEQAVHTNRTLEIAGHTVPMDLLGSSSIPIMMMSDYLKYQNSPDMDAEKAAWFITGATYLANMASATYSTRTGQYGRIVDEIKQGRDDKYAPKIGSIIGKSVGNLVIPFNRLQGEIASMFKGNANTGLTFGENLLQQLSVYGGFDKSHPAFDYRGRTIEIQEYAPSSLNGIVNMFEKGKKTDNIDRFLAKINFGYTDAYKQTKNQDDYKYSIINSDGTSRGFTDEEYYTFKLNTANKFNELIKDNAKQIEKLVIFVNQVKNEDETIAAQKSLVSDLLSEAKEQALMIVQKETDFTPNYKSMKRKEERDNRKINRQKSKIKLIGLDD